MGISLDEKTEIADGVYRFSSFRLDAFERRLWCDGELISLTPKQFDLLLYFVENAGRVARKDALLDAVWTDAHVDEATLARNVSWLRKMFKEHVADEPIIETVSKLGYRFIPTVTHANRDESVLILEEQIVQHIRGEEIITVGDAFPERPEGQLISASAGGKLEPIARPLPSRLSVSSAGAVAAFPRYLFFLTSPYFFIAVALIGAAGIILAQYNNRNAATAGVPGLNVKATVTIKNITVDTSRKNVEVGISIQPNDVVKVSAVGSYDPGNGVMIPFHGDPANRATLDYAFPNADPLTLVAWIGTEHDRADYFQTNKKTAYTAEKGGSLYLAVNDLKNGYAKNRGAIIAAVVIYRNFDITADFGDYEAAWGKELVRIHKQDSLAVRARGDVAYWEGGELYDLNGILPNEKHRNEYLAPQIDQRALIGKIGSRQPFKIGTDFPAQKMDVGGDLYISVNDQVIKHPESFKNNSGELTVDIEVVRQTEPITNPI